VAEYRLIDRCQICDSRAIKEIITLGDLPLVDALPSGEPSLKESSVKYPTPFLYCPQCRFCQLGCMVDQSLLFPVEYPYTSATTRILRHNFAELARECMDFIPLDKNDLVVDIGCNDGTLLNNFKDHSRVLGITPENMGVLARQKGITVEQSYLTREIVDKITMGNGKAKIVCATNVFAHFPDVHEALSIIADLLKPGGIFILECGYLPALLAGVQYDSIHHEHLRYYTLYSLKFLFEKHGMEIIHAKRVETHGGSLRVYAARRNEQQRHPLAKIEELLNEEKYQDFEGKVLPEFSRRVIAHKSKLYELLLQLKSGGKRIYGIGAPGRATVLLNYTGIDESLLDFVLETPASYKIGKFVPGTKVLIVDENKIEEDPPDYALMLSWHIGTELMIKLKGQGFKGDFIMPLPEVAIIKNNSVLFE